MRISDWSSDVCSSDVEILDPKSRQLRREMESATQYAQWRDAAAELDRREGLDQWQAEESGDEYDWRLIRSRLRQIRQYREEHDIDRQSVGSGKSGPVRVDIGGRRLLKKKKKQT